MSNDKDTESVKFSFVELWSMAQDQVDAIHLKRQAKRLRRKAEGDLAEQGEELDIALQTITDAENSAQESLNWQAIVDAEEEYAIANKRFSMSVEIFKARFNEPPRLLDV